MAGICVVTALEKMKEATERRFGRGPEAHFASVPVVVEAGDQTAGGAEHPPWQRSDRAVGLPAERFQSHSLRIGGASALYQATGQVEVVKRTGRWTSGAVHRYLHDGGDVIKGLAEHMASVDQYVHYT